jgi:hypothetical protein
MESADSGTEIIMVDWKVTATTIFCDVVNDEVTFIVSGDGTITCTGQQRYATPGRQSGPTARTCAGDECRIKIQHREHMLGNGTEAG